MVHVSRLAVVLEYWLDQGRVVLAWMAGLCVNILNDSDCAAGGDMSLIATAVQLCKHLNCGTEFLSCMRLWHKNMHGN